MPETRTTKQLKPGHYTIELCDGLRTEEKLLPIDPYVLGVWIGDGSSQSGRIYGSDADLPEIVSHINACGFETGPITKRRTVSDVLVTGLTSLLRVEGLLGNKHIPSQYLRASKAQRKKLLWGLMDTDGNGGVGCSFTTSNPILKEQFSELLSSLGIKSKYTARNRVLQYGGQQSVCETAWQFWFAPDFQVFAMTRKAAISPIRTRRKYHRIKSVEKTDSVPVRCLEIDSPTHLYLAGKGMIPTHNTNQDNKLKILNQMRDNYVLRMLRIRSVPLLEEMERIVQDGSEIQAEGRAKDDRAFATALAVTAWIDWVRAGMISTGQVYEKVVEEERIAQEQPSATMIGRVVTDFFRQAEQQRADLEDARAWKGIEG